MGAVSWLRPFFREKATVCLHATPPGCELCKLISAPCRTGLFFFFPFFGWFMGFCITPRYRLGDTGLVSQVTFASVFLQPGRGSHCPEKRIMFLFLWRFSLGPLWGCESLPVLFGADLCMAPTDPKPGQHPPLARLFGRTNGTIQQDKTPTFQILFRPPGCLRDLGAAAPVNAWLSPTERLVLAPHRSLAGLCWGCIYLQGQVGGLSAAPPGCACALPWPHWLARGQFCPGLGHLSA